MSSILTHHLPLSSRTSIPYLSRGCRHLQLVSPATKRRLHSQDKRVLIQTIHSATGLSSALRSEEEEEEEEETQGYNRDTDDTEQQRVQRIPNYSGWWTEVMKVRLEPQRMPDPSLNLSEGHVFQGKPATDATTPADDSFNPLNPLGTKVTKSSDSRASTSSISNDNNINNAINNNNNNNNSAAVEPAAQTDSRFSAASGFYDYHGYKIPVKPTPPGAEDCCMSGCAVCVYDVYEEDRQAYKESIAAVLKQLEAAGIPPPPELAGKHSQNTPEEDKDDDMDPSMKAFLELERKLKGG